MVQTKAVENLLERTRSAYVDMTAKSMDAHRRATSVLPGGDTRSSTFFHPYPIQLTHGSGACVYDLDGNRYVDFLNNYTSLVLGHAHPAVVERIQSAASEGIVFGAPHPAQVELAERICRRMPAVEQVRFCNSGTEAAMFAVRTSRYLTGRPFIIKMEGGYHGSADMLEVSIHPDISHAGPAAHPTSVPENKGIVSGQYAETLVAPFNDAEVCEALLDLHGGQVACILVEPMMGSAGAIPPKPGYLQSLREMTRRHGCLLVFDEIQTMRFAMGGAQALYGVSPDITAMGKIIGGGFPIGAIGASRDAMGIYDPRQKRGISHSGTFNGHPLIMSAGCTTLDVLDEQAIGHINRLADRLKRGLEAAFASHGLSGQVTGAGSILNVHFAVAPVSDYRTAEASPQALTSLLHLMMLLRGVFCAKRGMFNTSLPMQEGDVDLAIEAFNGCLEELRPVLEEDHSALVM
jgi:glutamate-1-semialdehyde 2,1-aminomutase